MRRAAIDCGVVLHAGSIVERTPDGKLYNTSLVFDAQGALLAAYRKIHRFGFNQGEAAVMSPGEHLVTFDLPGPEPLRSAWPPATTCASPSSTGACSTPERRR